MHRRLIIKKGEDVKIGVINRTFSVLKAFVDYKNEWGVRDLAKYMGYPVSTLHRVLLQLQEEGILEYNDNTYKYTIGPEFMRISSIVAFNIDVIKIAAPLMQNFVDKYGETVAFFQYIPNEKRMTCLKRIYGPNPLQYVVKVGELQSLIYGASGKSILAYLSAQEQELVINESILTELEVKNIKLELNLIQKEGYAITEDEKVHGAKGISSPIFNAHNEIYGCITFTAPLTIYNSLEENNIIEDIKTMANSISYSLGYHR